jgi:hypothetical protein
MVFDKNNTPVDISKSSFDDSDALADVGRRHFFR